jgi:hypothetical protein
MVPDGLWVVKFEKVPLAALIDVYDGKGTIGHLAFLADGERLDDGAHTILHIGPSGHHGAQDLAGECGKDIGFHAATQAIGKHKGGPPLRLAAVSRGLLLHTDLHIINTELLSIVIQ